MPEREVNPLRDRSPEAAYRPAPMRRPSHAEGSVTRTIEQQTAKIPSSVFLTAAVASLVASAAFEAFGNQRVSRFIGMWAPTLLITGVYNKLVKTMGPS